MAPSGFWECVQNDLKQEKCEKQVTWLHLTSAVRLFALFIFIMALFAEVLLSKTVEVSSFFFLTLFFPSSYVSCGSLALAAWFSIFFNTNMCLCQMKSSISYPYMTKIIIFKHSPIHCFKNSIWNQLTYFPLLFVMLKRFFFLFPLRHFVRFLEFAFLIIL